MQLAFDFLECDDNLAGKKWSLFTPYPRRVFDDATRAQSLSELGLTKSAMLVVQDDDA